MPQLDLQDLILNTLFKTDPKVIEAANLLMGDTLDLSEVIQKVESSFKKGDDGRREPIPMSYEEWRAIKKALHMCCVYFKEQRDQVNAMQKKIAPFTNIANLKNLSIDFDAGQCDTGILKKYGNPMPGYHIDPGHESTPEYGNIPTIDPGSNESTQGQ